MGQTEACVVVVVFFNKVVIYLLFDFLPQGQVYSPPRKEL